MISNRITSKYNIRELNLLERGEGIYASTSKTPEIACCIFETQLKK